MPHEPTVASESRTARRTPLRLTRGRTAVGALLGAVVLAAAPTASSANATDRSAAATTEWRLCMYLGGHPTLKKGDTGEAVRHLQCVLNEVYRYQTVPVNGSFEVITEASVKHLQQQFSLPGTGVVDAATWTALHP
ncbi:peptidoglycan-binding domain-containing protein [Streptomyces aureocirculatus]|uniref:peptidoglycan-binding domain-containing protein n=1 Tax=Streptomyces aureocirculatus TaxID=67275 RepID=UPI0004C8FC53|nr:peptidoglycan-binding domain-containing protein [Streptomyces aureocirculatus]